MREIQPINHNGSIQIKFSFSGKRYSFNPIPKGVFENVRDLATAKAISTKITNDILAGCFDPTLDRYRIVPKKPLKAVSKDMAMSALWSDWVDSLGISEATRAGDYDRVKAMISKTNPSITNIGWFVKSSLSGSTFNKRLGYLKSCCDWGVIAGMIEANPFKDVKPRKTSTKEIKPFTKDELVKIIDAFDRLAPSYSPFVKFLIATGVRTSEAVGLRWRHINFERNEIVIRESMPRDRTSGGYKKIRKETKTGNSRYLKMSLGLKSMLESLKPDKVEADEIVFKSVKGEVIDPNNFRERYWKPILKKISISYRRPYDLRHTFISHAIDQKIPLTSIAYMAGHKDTAMVIKVYGHMIDRPDLPEMPL